MKIEKGYDVELSERLLTKIIKEVNEKYDKNFKFNVTNRGDVTLYTTHHIFFKNSMEFSIHKIKLTEAQEIRKIKKVNDEDLRYFEIIHKNKAGHIDEYQYGYVDPYGGKHDDSKNMYREVLKNSLLKEVENLINKTESDKSIEDNAPDVKLVINEKKAHPNFAVFNNTNNSKMVAPNVIDVKGSFVSVYTDNVENTVSSERLQNKGYIVKNIGLNKDSSTIYNPWKYCQTEEDVKNMIKMLIDARIKYTYAGIWATTFTEPELMLLEMIALYIFKYENTNRHSFHRVKQYFPDIDNSLLFDRFNNIFERMHTQHPEDKLYDSWKLFSTTLPEKTIDSCLTDCRTMVKLIDMKYLGETADDDNLDLNNLKDKLFMMNLDTNAEELSSMMIFNILNQQIQKILNLKYTTQNIVRMCTQD